MTRSAPNWNEPVVFWLVRRRRASLIADEDVVVIPQADLEAVTFGPLVDTDEALRAMRCEITE